MLSEQIRKFMEVDAMDGINIVPDLIYIASPYWDEDMKLRQKRVEKVQLFTAQCINKGYLVLSPVAYTSQFQDLCDPPAGWYKFTQHLLSKCGRMWVCNEIPGWEQSLGIQYEIAFARGAGIPIEYKGLGDIK